MPPLALISSAAIWAPPGVAAPAVDWISAITPILMGSLDCAEAGDPAHAATPNAAMAIKKCANFSLGPAMRVAPFSIRLVDGLAEAQHRPLVKSNESARRVAAQMRQRPCKFRVLQIRGLRKFKGFANEHFAARHPPPAGGGKKGQKTFKILRAQKLGGFQN